MRQETFTLSIVLLLLMAKACSPAPAQLPSRTGLTVEPAADPRPVHLPSTPVVLQLPPSARLGAVLTGTGVVDRFLLTYDDLLARGRPALPVDDRAFNLPEDAALPDVVFEGRLQIPATREGRSKVVRDDDDLAADPSRLQLPAFNLQFVQDGSFLIPVTQGLVYTQDPYWNYIVGPGRIWKEDSDRGFARASFPFALVERNQNCTHNGVMTFLFDGKQVSPVRYQITQETCLYFKFDLWGQAAAAYTSESIHQAEDIKIAYAGELSNRLPTKPIEALAGDYPDAHVNLNRFGSGITPADMSVYGLVIDGVNYVSGCRTRYGEYAYCESLRLPSYSTAKSAFAAVALMRLGQKYGTGVYDLLIKDYVPEAASAAGNWSQVTFRNALDMATGNYDQAGFEIDESGATMAAFLDKAESYRDKMGSAFQFPGRKPPGEVWVYHTSDIFIVTQAMNNYLVQKEGSGADIFNFVRDEVYLPLHLSAGALTTLRTNNSPNGAAIGGYGLYWTRDDIAKISLLLNDQDGRINGNQVLEPGLLAASLQREPNDRGLNTTGTPVFNYRNGFWAMKWTPAENRWSSCIFWTPFMSGYGGISVVMIPNGSTYYYFSDNNEFVWFDAVNESNKLSPICP